MRLAVFGATGISGRLLVQQALAQGHEVRAYARNPAKLDTTCPGLQVVPGDIEDLPAIRQALAGADAVISLLGPTGRTRGHPVCRGMINIITAVRQHQAR
ncbi:MAG: NAD(P)H-binding protein [Bacillota bacterium]